MILGDHIKDRLIDYLSIRGSSTIKALVQGLHDAGYVLSQAQVYNIINTLLHTKVLTKHDGKVRLSARWIESIEEMYHRVEQQKDRDEISSMFCGDEKVFTAKTFHELNAIRHDVSAQLLSGYEGDVYYYDPHPYHLLGEYEREKKDLFQAKKKKGRLYYVLGGTSYLDRYGADLAKNQGAWVACTSDVLFSTQEFRAVVGEYVYRIRLDPKVAAYFEMFFSTVTSMHEFRHDIFYELFGMKGTYNLTLRKDNQYATEVRSLILGFFDSQS